MDSEISVLVSSKNENCMATGFFFKNGFFYKNKKFRIKSDDIHG